MRLERRVVLRYLKQFGIILGISFLGEILYHLIPLPIPASIYGLVLLAAALLTGLVKLEQVKQTGDFLSSLFPLLFIPTVAGVMEVWDLIAGNLVPIVIALVPVTWAVMAAAGKVTQIIMDRRENHG
jgi:holin-like protein